jgi:N-acetylmuramoyl-L-alanine amidase
MKKVLSIAFVAVLFLSLSFVPKTKKIVVLDVSHGGTDNSTQQGNYFEKDIVLSIANKIKDLNKDKKLEIVLTRESDHFITLTDRVDFINSQNPSVVLSLHINNTESSKVHGYDIHVKENFLTEESLLIAAVLESQFPAEIRKRKVSVERFFILKNSNCPAALIELGYLSNAKDRAYLTSEKGQWKIAEAIYKAVK